MADYEKLDRAVCDFNTYYLDDVEYWVSSTDALAALAFIDYMLYEEGVPLTFVAHEYDGHPMVVDHNELSTAGEGTVTVYGHGNNAGDALLNAADKVFGRVRNREKKLTRAMLLRRLWRTIQQLIWMK